MKKYILFILLILNIYAENNKIVESLENLLKTKSRKEFYESFKDKNFYKFKTNQFELTTSTQDKDAINKKNLTALGDKSDFILKSFYILDEKDVYSIYFVRDYAETLTVFKNNVKIADIDSAKFLGYYSEREISGYALTETFGSVFQATPDIMRNLSRNTNMNIEYNNQQAIYFDLDNDGKNEYIIYNQAENSYVFYKITNNKKTVWNYELDTEDSNYYLEFFNQNGKNYMLKIYYATDFIQNNVKKVDICYIKDKKTTTLDTWYIKNSTEDFIIDIDYSLVTGSIFKSIKTRGLESTKKDLDLVVQSNKYFILPIAFAFYNMNDYDTSYKYFNQIDNSDKYNKVTALVYKAIISSIKGNSKEAIDIKKQIEAIETSDSEAYEGGFPALTEEESDIYDSI